MNESRYSSYKRCRRAIDQYRDWAFDEDAHAALCDAAEGLLLIRPGEEEQAEALRKQAATVLAAVVKQRRLARAGADWVWRQLVECGPELPRTPAFRTAAAAEERSAAGFGV